MVLAIPVPREMQPSKHPSSLLGRSPMRSLKSPREDPEGETTMMTDQFTELKPGQEVIAEHEAIGELLGTIVHEDVTYLHVRRYGAGEDELFIPSIAIKRIVPKHIYLDVPPESLIAQPWHIRPGT
jgi:hypothetical protein